MANFAPFKTYILATLDELAGRHRLIDPFLDVGCGRGDVSLHLARRGWRGKAIDVSSTAIPVAQSALSAYPAVEVCQESLETQIGQHFNTIVMFDVLEHIADDHLALASAARLQAPGAFLVLTVPSNPATEWRWDDDLYGHVRRYRPTELRQVLAQCGYTVAEIWDISFPFFWVLRRGFTALKRPPVFTGTAFERTQHSSLTNAWDMGLISKILSLNLLWRPVLAIQQRFRNRPERGNEIMVLARRL